MSVVHGEEGLIGERGDPIGEVGVPDSLRALARSSGLLDHLGVPPGGFLFGHPTGALPLDAEQALDSGRPEPLRELELDVRHDGHLVFAEPVIG
jgi:hypothetical protein